FRALIERFRYYFNFLLYLLLYLYIICSWLFRHRCLFSNHLYLCFFRYNRFILLLWRFFLCNNLRFLLNRFLLNNICRLFYGFKLLLLLLPTWSRYSSLLIQIDLTNGSNRRFLI